MPNHLDLDPDMVPCVENMTDVTDLASAAQIENNVGKSETPRPEIGTLIVNAQYKYSCRLIGERPPDTLHPTFETTCVAKIARWSLDVCSGLGV